MLSTLVSDIYIYHYLYPCCIIHVIVIFLSFYPVFLLVLLGVYLPRSDVSFSIDHYDLSLVIVALPAGWWIGIGSSTDIFILPWQKLIQLEILLINITLI